MKQKNKHKDIIYFLIKTHKKKNNFQIPILNENLFLDFNKVINRKCKKEDLKNDR